LKIISRSMIAWLFLELTEGWRSWFSDRNAHADSDLKKECGVQRVTPEKGPGFSA